MFCLVCLLHTVTAVRFVFVLSCLSPSHSHCCGACLCFVLSVSFTQPLLWGLSLFCLVCLLHTVTAVGLVFVLSCLSPSHSHCCGACLCFVLSVSFTQSLLWGLSLFCLVCLLHTVTAVGLVFVLSCLSPSHSHCCGACLCFVLSVSFTQSLLWGLSLFCLVCLLQTATAVMLGLILGQNAPGSHISDLQGGTECLSNSFLSSDYSEYEKEIY